MISQELEMAESFYSIIFRPISKRLQFYGSNYQVKIHPLLLRLNYSKLLNF